MPTFSLDGIENLSQETLAILRKAATSGIYASTGANGVDLSPFTSLVVVNTPARNNTAAFPRRQAKEGSEVALWKTWLNVNSQQSSAAVGIDYAGSMTLFQEQDVYAPYRVLSKAGRVTLDAEAFGRNYVDLLSQGELGTMVQLFIAQDKMIVNAQSWALSPMGTVVLTPSTTGGSLATGDVYVRVAARSGANYYEGGSGPAGAEVFTAVTGPNGSVVASWAAVKGAVAYDVYVGSAAGAEYYYTTTTIGSVLITSVPTSATASALPASLPQLSSLYPGSGVQPLANPAVAGNGTPPTTDTSYSTNYYNGVVASSLGDYGALGPVTPGSGVSSGATFIDFGGDAPALSGNGVDVLDQINAALWATVQLSPTAYMMNSLQAANISKLLTSGGVAYTQMPATDAMARTNLAGGGYISQYINNSAGGVPVQIEVHPHVPPGTIIARTDRVPFPGSNIGSVFEVRFQYDTMRFDYQANYNPGVAGGGPRHDFDIRSNETLVNRAPVAQAIVSNINV